jgi:hypothetical protein
MTDAPLLETIAPRIGLLLTAGLGAFLGSYLKKKAENLAIREDLDKLVDQVSEVTRATQRIEARTTRSLRVYERQLDILAKLYRHLHDALALFQGMTRGDAEPKEYAPLVQKSMKAGYEELVDGRLFIPPALVQKCEEFFKVTFEGHRDFSWATDPMNLDPSQRGEYWRKAASAAHEQVPTILRQIEEAARSLIDG